MTETETDTEHPPTHPAGPPEPLARLHIDGLDRQDSGRIPFFASYKTPDGIHVSVYDVRGADRTAAYWIRTYGEQYTGDIITDDHIAADAPTDIPTVVAAVHDAVTTARMRRATPAGGLSAGLDGWHYAPVSAETAPTPTPGAGDR